MIVQSCQSLPAEETDLNGSWATDVHRMDEVMHFAQPALYGNGD